MANNAWRSVQHKPGHGGSYGAGMLPPMKTSVLFCLVAVVSATGLAGCGGGGDGTPAPGSAAECFNPALYGTGPTTTYQLDYQEKDNSNFRYRGIGTAAANGQGGGRVTEQRDRWSNPVNPDGPPTGTSFLTTLYGIDGRDVLTTVEESGGSIVTTLNGVVRTFESRVRTLYDPSKRDPRYHLAPGESYMITALHTDTLTENITLNGAGDTTRSGVVSESSTVTYVGQEAITVPAGTYQACRFEVTIPILTGTVIYFPLESFTTVWIAKGKGVMVRGDRKDAISFSTTVLMGTSRLNGAPI